MTEALLSAHADVDVIIVGAGPAGLAAAAELKRLGVETVIILEREKEAGGIPRHCLHSPYGMREWSRIMFGPAYARRLVQDALDVGVHIFCETTVTKLGANGEVETSSHAGMQTLKGRAVLLATGARETSRAARMIGGTKPAGVMNTATLQSFAAFSKHSPFKRPVIVGTELVSFSALLTCRAKGIKPAAMLEENAQLTCRTPFALAAKGLGVPLSLRTKILKIHGVRQVSAVRVQGPDGPRDIACDGVIFTGGFRPENALVCSSALELDMGSQGPCIDQYGRLSDPAYFCAGNALRGIETAGWCWKEGRRVARSIEASLRGALPPRSAARTPASRELSRPEIKFALPQVISPMRPDAPVAFDQMQLRVSRPFSGAVDIGGSSYQITAKPERRILRPLPDAPSDSNRVS